MDVLGQVFPNLFLIVFDFDWENFGYDSRDNMWRLLVGRTVLVALTNPYKSSWVRGRTTTEQRDLMPSLGGDHEALPP